MNGSVFDIQRFCVDDGPGIRTVVFLKGCPLRCIWCHNPESQLFHKEVLYDPEKCVGCGACVDVCTQKCHSNGGVHTFTRQHCIACGACVAMCPNKALELCGKQTSVDEVFTEVKKDKTFYDTSGGGVTVSGGEPLFQPEFTAELLKLCKENRIHTSIETSGFANENIFLSVIKYCDLVLFDIKETDEERHKHCTGVSLKPILKNLNLLNENNIPFIIRAPIIPGINDTELHFDELRAIRSAMRFCQGIQIMPYHKLGMYKYELLGRAYSCGEIDEPANDIVASWEKLV